MMYQCCAGIGENRAIIVNLKWGLSTGRAICHPRKRGPGLSDRACVGGSNWFQYPGNSGGFYYRQDLYFFYSRDVHYFFFYPSDKECDNVEWTTSLVIAESYRIMVQIYTSTCTIVGCVDAIFGFT
jgi:hypothetical protein